MEKLVRESDGTLRGPALGSAGTGLPAQMPGVLRRRPDDTFERVITLERSDVSPSKAAAETGDGLVTETQGDDFVRPRSRSSRQTGEDGRRRKYTDELSYGEIDGDASMSKQTVQAIRMLQRRHMYATSFAVTSLGCIVSSQLG
jgi:hypothetical protein